MSEDNRETIWERDNRIDAENAEKNAHFRQEREAYAAERAREHDRTSRYYADLEQRSPPPANGSTLSISLGVAFVCFLLLLWGSQFVLLQVSRLFGASSLDAGLAAVSRVNGLLVLLLGLGAGLGWLTWVRRGGIGRIFRRVLFFTVLALAVGAWQLSLGLQAVGSADEPDSVAASQPSAAPAPSEPPVATEPTVPGLAVSAPETREVTADVLILRAEPSTEAAILDRLRAKQQVALLGEERQIGDILWTKVQVGERVGWVSSEYLR